MVVAVQEADGPVTAGSPLGVPLPIIVIPILPIEMPLVQVQVPDGMLMMSPSTAVCVGPLMIAFTSLRLQVAAV